MVADGAGRPRSDLLRATGERAGLSQGSAKTSQQTVINTCFRCHGVMGKRQLDIDHGYDPASRRSRERPSPTSIWTGSTARTRPTRSSSTGRWRATASAAPHVIASSPTARRRARTRCSTSWSTRSPASSRSARPTRSSDRSRTTTISPHPMKTSLGVDAEIQPLHQGLPDVRQLPHHQSAGDGSEAVRSFAGAGHLSRVAEQRVSDRLQSRPEREILSGLSHAGQLRQRRAWRGHQADPDRRSPMCRTTPTRQPSTWRRWIRCARDSGTRDSRGINCKG